MPGLMGNREESSASQTTTAMGLMSHIASSPSPYLQGSNTTLLRDANTDQIKGIRQ